MRRLLSATAAALMVTAVSAAPARAAMAGDIVKEIMRFMPRGAESRELRSAIEEYADQTNATFDTVAAEALKEIQAKGRFDTIPVIAYKPLPPPAHAGDIVYMWPGLEDPHGFLWLYLSSTEVLRCDVNSGLTVSRVADVSVAHVSRLLYVKQPRLRDKAVAWARQQVGKRFSANIAVNKVPFAENAHGCTGLVWRAYRHFGVDLDSDRGVGVYPVDIYKSPHVYEYERV